MNKKQKQAKAKHKKHKRIQELLDKAVETGDIEKAFDVVKRESFMSVDDKYTVIFNLGRFYESQIAGRLVENLKQTEKANGDN